MVNTELYFDIETNEWKIKNKETGEERSLNTLLESLENDSVSIEFTGFKPSKEVIEKELAREKYNKMLKHRGIREVSGEEAYNLILNGEKLWKSPRMDEYLSHELIDVRFCFKLTNIYRGVHNSHVVSITKKYIEENKWFVKE
ncbi:hypothetical protein P9X10_02575 [Bacillus cereus]|nr:hypothetical protein [Bacillus cereus]